MLTVVKYHNLISINCVLFEFFNDFQNHLAEKGFIHRDLAARNILVGSDNRVKVSDFGLMREIYEDVYSGKNMKKLSVKWMAPESINDSIYTLKTEV